MKTRLNLTIDEATLELIKAYAASKETSVSELVESYFKKIAKPPARRKNILQLVEKLKKPVIDPKADLKELFYQEQTKKYGL
jgi:Family of unknown function (DUF6364)